jgi:hypothetical protein
MKVFMLAVLALPVWLWTGAMVLAQDQPRGTKLTGEDLAKLVEPGILLEGRNWQFDLLTSTVLVRGGTIYTHYIDRGGNSSQDKGKWRIAGDTLCFALAFATGETEQCRTYYRLDDGSLEGLSNPGNKRLVTFRVRRWE